MYVFVTYTHLYVDMDIHLFIYVRLTYIQSNICYIYVRPTSNTIERMLFWLLMEQRAAVPVHFMKAVDTIAYMCYLRT